METDFVAFLRGISNVPMQPFRDALVNAGLTCGRSHGGTGNLLFRSDEGDPATLERRIAKAVGTETFVRSRSEMVDIVAGDPFAGRPGAAVFLARASIDSAASLFEEDFEAEPPVAAGKQVYFVHPLRRPGRKGIVDFERELGVRGTMRASRVMARVLELM